MFLSMAAPDTKRGIARAELLTAAVDVIRAKGLNATSVDDLCAAAGVSKGAFFHHFASKEELAVAAAEHWSTMTGGLFASADYHRHADPLDRVLSYLDLRRDLVAGDPAQFTCLAGTMVQEAYSSSPAVRDACAASIFGHAASLEPDFAAVIAAYAAPAGVTAHSLAVHTQTVLQGSFVMAKAADDPEIVRDAIEHLRRYLQGLFRPDVRNTNPKESA